MIRGRRCGVLLPMNRQSNIAAKRGRNLSGLVLLLGFLAAGADASILALPFVSPQSGGQEHLSAPSAGDIMEAPRR